MLPSVPFAGLKVHHESVEKIFVQYRGGRP